jgi:hypothetical protein
MFCENVIDLIENSLSNDTTLQCKKYFFCPQIRNPKPQFKNN